jgi:death-on-curing protein
MNHAFIDGNKRVAWAASMIFLRMNGYRVRVSADHAERFLIDQVITRRAEIAPIAEWLERSMHAV